MEEQKFYIDEFGTRHVATILTYFEIYGDYYCIYTIPIDNTQNNQVYCAKVVGNNLERIKSEKEKTLTSKIVKELVNALQNLHY